MATSGIIEVNQKIDLTLLYAEVPETKWGKMGETAP